jgi:hypothetical protein
MRYPYKQANSQPAKPTTPLNGGQRALNRNAAQYLSNLAQRLGRCGDIHPLTGHVCVTQPHADDEEHMAVQIGGPHDGYVYARWGGHRAQTDTGLSHRNVNKGKGTARSQM